MIAGCRTGCGTARKRRAAIAAPVRSASYTVSFPKLASRRPAFVHAFLGAQIGTDGLTLTPRVPSELQSVRAADIDFRGATFDLEASKTALQIRCTANPKNATFLVNGKPQRGTSDVTVPLNASTRAVTLFEGK